MNRRIAVPLLVIAALAGAAGVAHAGSQVPRPASQAPASVAVVAAPLAVGTDAAAAEGLTQTTVLAPVTNISSALDTGAIVARLPGSFPSMSAQATSVTLHHVLFSDPAWGVSPLKGPSGSAPKNISAWMVTFHGVTGSKYGGDGQSYPNANSSVFIDADSGQAFLQLVYTPSHQ